MTLTYESLSRGTAKQLSLAPYTLVMYRDAFYLQARLASKPDGDLRLYSLDRMKAVTFDRSETFSIPDDYDPSARFGDKLGVWTNPNAKVERIEIAFDATVVRVIQERQWAGFVELLEMDDGRWKLALELPVTPEVRVWVLTWGQHAEVLAPASLRQEVAMELAAASARYA